MPRITLGYGMNMPLDLAPLFAMAIYFLSRKPLKAPTGVWALFPMLLEIPY
jgi:hypothetical protein